MSAVSRRIGRAVGLQCSEPRAVRHGKNDGWNRECGLVSWGGEGGVGVTSSSRVLSLLVVEDEPSIRFAIREYFEAEGWQVTCVSTALEAEQTLKCQAVDVAVLDLRLGVDDVDGGLVLAAWITRASPLTRTVLLTGYGSEATRKKALEAGVSEILDKPTRLRELSRLVTRLAAGETGDSVVSPA